jgi:hypothetical protein
LTSTTLRPYLLLKIFFFAAHLPCRGESLSGEVFDSALPAMRGIQKVESVVPGKRLAIIARLNPTTGRARYLCSGYFIDNEWLVTAAHGLDGVPFETLIVLRPAGAEGRVGEVTMLPDRILIPSDATVPPGAQDLALIRVGRPSHSSYPAIATSAWISLPTLSEIEREEVVSLGWDSQSGELMPAQVSLRIVGPRDAWNDERGDYHNAGGREQAGGLLAVRSSSAQVDLGPGNSGCPHFVVTSSKEWRFLGTTAFRYQAGPEAPPVFFLTPGEVIAEAHTITRYGGLPSGFRETFWEASTELVMAREDGGSTPTGCKVSEGGLGRLTKGRATVLRPDAKSTEKKPSRVHRWHFGIAGTQGEPIHLHLQLSESLEPWMPEIIAYTFPYRSFLGRSEMGANGANLELLPAQSGLVIVTVDAVAPRDFQAEREDERDRVFTLEWMADRAADSG